MEQRHVDELLEAKNRTQTIVRESKRLDAIERRLKDLETLTAELLSHKQKKEKK